MIGLQQSRCMRAELLELLLKKLLLIIGDGLFVQNQDLRYVIVVNLCGRLARSNSEQQKFDKPCLSDL